MDYSLRCFAFATLCMAAQGCNAPTYLVENRQLDTASGTTVAMGMVVASMNGSSDTDTFDLPVALPPDDVCGQLADLQQMLGLMMPVPTAAASDIQVEIDYTITNLDAAEAHVTFGLIGGNEFGLYDPTMYANPDDPEAVAPPSLLGRTPFVVPASGQFSGTFREDEIAEASTDLEAIVRYPGPSDLTIPFKVLTSHPDISNIGFEAIPPGDITPLMVHYTFLLSADAHVQADYVVRVRDPKHLLGLDGQELGYCAGM